MRDLTPEERESLARLLIASRLLRAEVTDTRDRLAAVTAERDAAVAIAREWDDDFQRFVSGGCDVAAVKDRRARLATLTGEG